MGIRVHPQSEPAGWADPSSVIPTLPSTETPDGFAPGSPLRDQNGKNIGKIMSTYGSLGLAMIRREAAGHLDSDTTHTTFLIEGSETTVQLIKPHWWRGYTPE
jgi:hypothetical protein